MEVLHIAAFNVCRQKIPSSQHALNRHFSKAVIFEDSSCVDELLPRISVGLHKRIRNLGHDRRDLIGKFLQKLFVIRFHDLLTDRTHRRRHLLVSLLRGFGNECGAGAGIGAVNSRFLHGIICAFNVLKSTYFGRQALQVFPVAGEDLVLRRFVSFRTRLRFFEGPELFVDFGRLLRDLDAGLHHLIV